jgi:hypothetical protein
LASPGDFRASFFAFKASSLAFEDARNDLWASQDEK